MNLRYRTKLILYFIFLCFILLLTQVFFLYFNHISLIPSLLFSMIITLPAAYVISYFLSQSILKITQKTIQFISTNLNQEVHVYSHDELAKLSKTIDEMGIQLRKRINEISKEKEYLQTILKGMVEGVLMVDTRGRILMVNDVLRSLLSLSSDVVDRMPLEIIRNAELEGAIRMVTQGHKIEPFELILPAAKDKIFEVNVVGILSSPGEKHQEGESIKGAIAVFHDITRLKELEKIRQDFVANVSHELRTPLTTIKGYAETLLEGALKEEIASQFVQIIKKQTDRLTKIVDDLLTLSKIESKEFQLRMENISLPEMIDDVLDFVKETAEKKKISIIRDKMFPSLAVEVDRNYLEQVFINLIDNAIKYTHEGGKVFISASIENQKEIRFAIQDNGIGIPKEDIPRIFERFYRVDKGRSQKLGGTGLGLSIVKHIIKAHGGRVWTESNFGEGSIFYFTLPIKP